MKPTILTPDSMAILLLPLAVALVVFYFYIYSKEARQARQLTARQKQLLRALRAIVALLAVMAMVRPAVSTIRREVRLPVVPVVIDESTSMGYPDARENESAVQGGGGKRTRFETATLVAQQLQETLTLTHRVKIYTFSDTLKLVKDLPHRDSERTPAVSRDDLFPMTMKPLGEYTNVGDALDGTWNDLIGEKVPGIVLLSDGRETGGTPMKEIGAKAAKFGVPIHAIAEGNEHPLADLRVDEVIVDNEASMNDVLVAQVKVTNQVRDVLDTELTLLDKTAKKPTIKKLRLKRGPSTITVATVPDSVGVHEYHLELPKYPDEVRLDNNSADFAVNVVKRDMRTLLIAGAPNREYFYLVPALLRHPTINLACWLQSAGPLYTHQGHTTLTNLPKTSEELKSYDVVILYDVNPNRLDGSQIAAIEDIVNRGAGLMVIGGPNYGLAAMIQVHPTLFRQLLPVEIDKGQLPNPDTIHDRPFLVERTDQGKTHETLVASGDPRINDQIWGSFPKMFWAHPIQGLKPGATSLLHRSDDKGKTGSVMAVMRYGNGKILYSGMSSFWRWRFPSESYDFDNFWLRTLRYLGNKEEGGKQTNQVALNTDRSSYSPGEDVQITMKVLDPSLKPQLAGQKVYAKVSSAGDRGDPEMAALVAGPDLTTFQGVYRPRQVGNMAAQVQVYPPSAGSDARPIIDTPRVPFQVQLEALEAKDTSANLEGMKNLAEQTGGKYFDYRNMNEVAALPASIPRDPQVLNHPVTVEIWDGAIFELLFLVLICAEWSLRKFWGLL